MSSLRKPDFHVNMTPEEWRYEKRREANIRMFIWFLQYVMPIIFLTIVILYIIEGGWRDGGWSVLFFGFGIGWVVLGYSRILTKVYKMVEGWRMAKNGHGTRKRGRYK